MRTIFILCSIFIMLSFSGFAQQLPPNECGIVNTYDASGNRLRRLYFCNNGIDPYPLRPILDSQKIIAIVKENTPNVAKPNVNAANAFHPKPNDEFQIIDALYPNPTTGKFSITFSKELHDAAVLITDVNGKMILHFNASGYKVDFNLSSLATGIYFVKINDGGNVISKKVVKQ